MTGYEITEERKQTGYVDPETGKFVPTDDQVAVQVQTGEDAVDPK